jgi:hypothetical protein
MTSYPPHTEHDGWQWPQPALAESSAPQVPPVAAHTDPWPGPRHRHLEDQARSQQRPQPWATGDGPIQAQYVEPVPQVYYSPPVSQAQYPQAAPQPGYAQPTPVQVPQQRTGAVYAPVSRPAPQPGDAGPAAVPVLEWMAGPVVSANAHEVAGPATVLEPAPVQWPMPGELVPAGARWTPQPEVAALITPLLRGLLVSRLVTATVAHANHCLQNLRVPASEPGPHALLVLSAVPQYREPEPTRPTWFRRSSPDVDDCEPTAKVRIASRLVGIGAGDDLLDMLSTLTGFTTKDVAAAAADRKLLHQHDRTSRAALAEALTLGASAVPFPYAQALEQGVLWDPRMPHTGLAPTSKEPLTADTLYVGVAVTTLDTPAARWVDAKDDWRGARDSLGLPVTGASLPGTAWVVLDDGTALQIERSPGTQREPRAHTVITNAPVDSAFDRLTGLRLQRDLVQVSPPLPRLVGQSAQLSADLWDHVADLHTALRSAFGYEVQQ